MVDGLQLLHFDVADPFHRLNPVVAEIENLQVREGDSLDVFEGLAAFFMGNVTYHG